MSWFRKLVSSDPSVSLMCIVVLVVLVDALVIFNYIVFFRHTIPMTSQESTFPTVDD